MKIRLATLGALFLAYNSAFAQGAGTPKPGLWEVTTTMKAGAKKMSPPTDQRCLTVEDVVSFEQFFITPPTGESDAPQCKLKKVERGATSSVWSVDCQGPRGKMEGTGEAIFSDAAYTAKQSFKMGMMRMTMTTQAKHLGPC